MPTAKKKTGTGGTPTPREAKQAATKTRKPQVTNGGAAGNARKPRDPMQNADLETPHAESRKQPRKPRAPEATCDAQTRQTGEPCRHPAGFRTDHPGTGRCWLHGGKSLIRTGRYATVERPHIQALLEQFAADPDPLNLTPEVLLTRALLMDYINRWHEQDAMLTRWHLSFEKAFQGDWQDWWRDMRADAMEREDDLSDELLAQMPDPMSYLPSKPLRMADITEVKGLLMLVGALVDKVRKGATQHTFSMDMINVLWKIMAGHLTDAALEEVKDDDVRNAFLSSVEQRWGTISLAELASRRAAD